MHRQLKRLLKTELAKCSEWQAELGTLNGGNLNVTRKNGKDYFIEYSKGRQLGISKDMNRVYSLARKKYLQQKVKDSRTIIELLENAVRIAENTELVDRAERVIMRFDMLDLNRIKYNAEAQKWFTNHQSQNPYKREHLIYATDNGVKMRSKSERFIGNFLEQRNIPYMYEHRLVINGEEMYPDFMILREDREIVIWEHAGYESDEYYMKQVNRIRRYRDMGYRLYSNLIYTFEPDLEDMRNLEEILACFMLS